MKNFNKMVVPGTGKRDETGNVYPTEIGKQRIHRAIEEAAIRDISLRSKQPFILISGGYSPELFDAPPKVSEAKSMADYALRIYGRDGLTANAFLLEEESTNTKENITKSLLMYPEFFQETISGERRIGIVSQAAHVGRAAVYASEALPCSIDAITQVSIRDRYSSVPDLSSYRVTSDQLQLAGDE